MRCGSRGALTKHHEHGLHADRSERHVRGGEADWDEQVFAFILLGHDRSVRDRVRAEPANLDIALVADVAVGVDVALGVMRVHRVGAHADRVVDLGLALAVELGHNVRADHSSRFADVELA